jgi:hypothetical protein
MEDLGHVLRLSDALTCLWFAAPAKSAASGPLLPQPRCLEPAAMTIHKPGILQNGSQYDCYAGSVY